MRSDELFEQLAAECPVPGDVAAEVDAPFVLASNVHRLRGIRGLSQADLARRAGISQPRIAEIERGDANPRLATLAKLAHVLGVTVSALLDGDEGAAPTGERAAQASQRKERSWPGGQRRLRS